MAAAALADIDLNKSSEELEGHGQPVQVIKDETEASDALR